MFSSAASAVLAMMFAFTTGCLQDTESASIESIDGAEHEEGVVPEDPPDPDTAEYVGDVDFVSDEEFDAALAAWHAQAAERPMYATDEELAASDDGSRGVMVLADGRVYRATASEPSDGELERLRVPAKVLAPVSQVTWTGIYLGIVGQTPANEPDDGRSRTTLTTGSFKSMVKITSDGGWSGSGVIVGPRHVLTAAHNVYETNSNVMRANVKVRLPECCRRSGSA